MKFFIETIGCQMNVNDSEKIALFLLEHGCRAVNDIEKADIVILNTCSVRFSAEHKAYSFLGRVREYKQQKPDMIVAVVGCMAQYAYKEIKQRFDFVNFVLGAKHIDEFSKYISKYIDINKTSVAKIQNNIRKSEEDFLRNCIQNVKSDKFCHKTCIFDKKNIQLYM